MKTVIATIIALSVAAPAFAASDVAAQFALSNDSAAERIIGDTSTGDANAALNHFLASKESSAERNNLVIDQNADVSRDVKAFFALGNDSAAERIVK